MSVHLLNEDSFLDKGVTDDDLEKAKISANDGDAEALYHLALMFDTGRGVDRNPKEAENLYIKAAEKGHAEAQYFLARMYSIETSGIDRNETEAARWYKCAAEQGHSGALVKLG